MTVDREELRRRLSSYAERRKVHHLGHEPGDDIIADVPGLLEESESENREIYRLLDELDAKDRRIAELEAEARKEAASTHALGEEYEKQGMDLAFHRHGHNDALATVAELTLRLSIATETNVADRKRIAELEAGLREALGYWQYPPLTHQEKTRKDEIWAMLPSEET